MAVNRGRKKRKRSAKNSPYQLTGHHIVPQSWCRKYNRALLNDPDNKIGVIRFKHEAYHEIFNDFHPREIIFIVSALISKDGLRDRVLYHLSEKFWADKFPWDYGDSKAYSGRTAFAKLFHEKKWEKMESRKKWEKLARCLWNLFYEDYDLKIELLRYLECTFFGDKKPCPALQNRGALTFSGISGIFQKS